jgi:acyl carrier protein
MGSKSESLRQWIRDLHSEPVEVGDETDLIETGLVSSLQFVSMVVEIERLHGRRLEPTMIRPSSMRTLDGIDRAVFRGA